MRKKNQRLKKFGVLDLFIIIIFLFIAAASVELFRRDLLQTFKLQNVEHVGTVVVKRNTVQRRLGDRVIWDRLANESPVYYWDLIRVADLSSATLYIGDTSLSLEDNSLIRIVPSADGEGVTVVVSSGTISVVAGENTRGLSIEAGGQLITPQPGTFVRTTVEEESGRGSTQVVESVAELVREGVVRERPTTRLTSPQANSRIRYYNELPVVNFQWSEVEEAAAYLVEISPTPDFSNPRVVRQSSTAFLAESSLPHGLWYWRVMPVFPSIFTGYSNYSRPSFFVVEQVEALQVASASASAQEASFAQWLEAEAPSTDVPPQVPRELIPANLIPPPQPPPPPEPPPPPRPQPPPLLAAPGNLRPARGAQFGYAQLITQRQITFNWNAVQGANRYTFTLYHQTAAGRRLIVRENLTRTSYTLNNLGLLDRGTFVWQVETSNVGRGNVIQRRGRTAESVFIIDFPSPSPVLIEDTGILYGN